MSKRKGERNVSGNKKDSHGPQKVYTLSVYIVDGPLPKRFEGRKISRTIRIPGTCTLRDIHNAIFKAYGRWDWDHLNEFLLWKDPRKRPADLDIRRPDMRIGTGGGSSRSPANTTLGSLGLREGQTFAYRFDFGDDWLHRINVDRIEALKGGGTRPEILARSGGTPPQYPDDEDE